MSHRDRVRQAVKDYDPSQVPRWRVNPDEEALILALQREFLRQDADESTRYRPDGD